MRCLFLLLKRVVLLLAQKLLQLIDTLKLDFVQPSLLQWTLVDNSWLIFQLRILLEHFATDWCIDVRCGLKKD